MPGGWPAKIDRWKVEWNEIPRPGGAAFLDLSSRPSGCLHTTEGSDVDSAISGNRAKGFGSHLYIGNDRIVACRPIDKQASSLLGGETTNHLFIQIEAVMRLGGDHPEVSPPSTGAHLMKPGTIEPLIAAMRWLRDHRGIPLARPDAWKDDCSDLPLPWAVTTNTRRLSGLALKHHGWVGHLEVPENDHYDPGKFRWEDAFQLVDEGDEDMNLDEYIEGQKAYEAAFKTNGGDPGGPPKDQPRHFDAGWRSARFSASAARASTDTDARMAAAPGLTEEQLQTLTDAKAFLDELRDKMGKLTDTEDPAAAKFAGRRVAKAVLESEGET